MIVYCVRNIVYQYDDTQYCEISDDVYDLDSIWDNKKAASERAKDIIGVHLRDMFSDTDAYPDAIDDIYDMASENGHNDIAEIISKYSNSYGSDKPDSISLSEEDFTKVLDMCAEEGWYAFVTKEEVRCEYTP